jgi:hypothetical protein
MTRKLDEKEYHLIKHLLSLVSDKRGNIELPVFVEDMNDGGMGSIQFGSRNGRCFGRDVVQVKYIDRDDVPVFITLIEDDQGALFELEFWKVNFEKLVEFPTPTQVVFQK